MKAKGLKLFVEFPAAVPGLTIGKIEAGNMTFQRIVVTTDAFAGLARNRLLYAHGAQWVQAGPYAASQHASCYNGTTTSTGSTVHTRVRGSWPELCGGTALCTVLFTGHLCTNGSHTKNIMWASMQNMNSSAKWDRVTVDSVPKWLGFCGVSPTGLTLPEHMCTADKTNASANIKPLLVTARVAGYDTAVFGLQQAGPSPILFEHPTEPSITIATTKLSLFVQGRFAPLGAWKIMWKELLRSLVPWAGPIELEWEAAVGPAYNKDEALPADAGVSASMTGVEWLRGRSGLLPGPKQLTHISAFLDPRWVNTKKGTIQLQL